MFGCGIVVVWGQEVAGHEEENWFAGHFSVEVGVLEEDGRGVSL